MTRAPHVARPTLGRAIDRPRQAVIVAGGRGTRLAPLTHDRPKSMVEFGGKPFLGYLLELLQEEGFASVLLLLGFRAEVILRYLEGDAPTGITIDALTTNPDDETSSRMIQAGNHLAEHFLFLYSDNYWPLRMEALWADYVQSEAPAMVTVYRNADGYTRDNVRVSGGRITKYDPSRTAQGLGGVDIGYAILPRNVLDLVDATDRPFEKVVYPHLVRQGQLAAHVTDHRYYSIGSPDRLPATEVFLARQPAIILDRDGVLNRRVGRGEYVRRPEEFDWLPGVPQALKSLADAGYRLIVVSNQAGIARGVMSADDLARIEIKMQADLDTLGVHIDRFYYCPHGWDEGCSCRKPMPGMLYQAQRDFHLDLTRTLFVGDDERDRMAAVAAGCKFEMVGESRSFNDIVDDVLLQVTTP